MISPGSVTGSCPKKNCKASPVHEMSVGPTNVTAHGIMLQLLNTEIAHAIPERPAPMIPADNGLKFSP